jgi:hypothetical protein
MILLFNHVVKFGIRRPYHTACLSIFNYSL